MSSSVLVSASGLSTASSRAIDATRSTRNDCRERSVPLARERERAAVAAQLRIEAREEEGHHVARGVAGEVADHDARTGSGVPISKATRVPSADTLGAIASPVTPSLTSSGVPVCTGVPAPRRRGSASGRRPARRPRPRGASLARLTKAAKLESAARLHERDGARRLRTGRRHADARRVGRWIGRRRRRRPGCCRPRPLRAGSTRCCRSRAACRHR